MTVNNCSAVWFNQEAVAIYEELKKEGLISQSFKDFVKAAFHDKADSLNITKITQRQIEKNTQAANTLSP